MTPEMKQWERTGAKDLAKALEREEKTNWKIPELKKALKDLNDYENMTINESNYDLSKINLDKLQKRLLTKIKINNKTGCWDWISCTDINGYARFQLKYKNVRAHRISYTLFVGKIPRGMTIDHLCRNRKCVNPAHLEPATQKENTMRGDTITAIHARKTHCPKCGGKYEKLVAPYINNGRGRRFCRACQQLYQRKRLAKQYGK